MQSQDLRSRLHTTEEQLASATARIAELEAQLLHRPGDDRFRRILDDLREGAEIIGFDWRYLYVNDASAKHGRQQREVLLKSTVLELYPGFESTPMYTHLQACMTDRVARRFEQEFVFPDGETACFELRVQPVPEGIFILSDDITERKAVERARQRQLRYHASLQENVSDAVIVADMSFNIQSWNHAAERIYGWSAAEAVGRTTAEVMRTAYAEPGDRDHIIRTLHEQGWWHGEVTQRHRDGTAIHVLASVTMVRDETGAPFGVVSVNHDISERQKVNAALRESEEKFRKLLDAAPIATIISDSGGRISLVNVQAEALFGFDRSELIGQTVEIVVPEYARDQHVRNRATYLAAPRVRRMGSHLELFARRKDGSNFPVEIELSFIETKDGIMVMSFVIDITERKRIATELERQRSFLRNVIDVSPNMIFVKDFDGRFVLANPVVARMYSVTPDELINRTDADFNPSIREVEHFLDDDRRVIASGEALFVEEPLTTSEGETRWLQTTKVPIISEDGETKYVLGVSTDITERKKAEDALKQALAKEKELGELKTRFVSMASHEFRTPLATILALTETLIAYRHRLTDEQIDERFDKVKEQIDHLRNIMEDVLLLARMQARRVEFNPALLNLDDLCRSVIDGFENSVEYNHVMRYTCIGDIRPVMVDRKLMRQIISNIVSNAIKYSPEGAAIDVSLSFSDEAVILSVRDEGIGIPEADLKHLFEPFHRADNVGTISGTGLGLVITRESIELHGGTIDVESQLNAGSTFTVRLPLAPAGDITLPSPESPQQGLRK